MQKKSFKNLTTNKDANIFGTMTMEEKEENYGGLKNPIESSDGIFKTFSTTIGITGDSGEITTTPNPGYVTIASPGTVPGYVYSPPTYGSGVGYYGASTNDGEVEKADAVIRLTNNSKKEAYEDILDDLESCTRMDELVNVISNLQKKIERLKKEI